MHEKTWRCATKSAAAAVREKKCKWTTADRRLWVWLSRIWSDWRSALAIVQPETVVAWHRAGFRLFWTWKVRRGRCGRPLISREIRDLIRQMCREIPVGVCPASGGATQTGVDVGESSVSKYMVRSCGPPSQTWRTFLENHARRLVSIDFFTVPTLRFQFLRLAEEERRTRGNMIRILLEDALKEKEHKE